MNTTDVDAGLIAAVVSFLPLFLAGNRLRAGVQATGGKRYGFIALSILLFFFGLVCSAVAVTNAGAVGSLLGAIGLVLVYFGWHRNKEDEIPEGEGLERGGMGWTSTAPAPAKPKAKRKADTYDWDNYYEQLIELNGCGPTTAQIIISKVQTERELTDREYAFWDQVG